MIRSKLSLAAYFFTLLPASFVVLGLVFLFHPHWLLENKLGGTNSAVVPGIILVVGMGAVLVFLLRAIVILIVDRDRLCLYSLGGSRRIESGDILSIDLWGRSRFNGAPSEMIQIELKDGEKVDFNGWFCRNLPKIKRTLAAEYPGLVAATSHNRVRPGDSADPEVFSGLVIPSVNGIMFYGFLLVAIYESVHSGIMIAVPFLLFLPILVILGIQLYYFRLIGDELEIRNHVLPGYRKRYPLKDVAGIFLESRYNWSRTLRVRTYDYHSKSYSAGTLRDRHWLALGKALKKRGIKTKSEIAGIKLSA